MIVAYHALYTWTIDILLFVKIHDWQCNNNGDYDNIETPGDFVTEHNWGISPLILGHPNCP